MTRYAIVKRMTACFGFQETEYENDWHLCWSDSHVTLEMAKSMRSFQKVNHFPRMGEICRKDLMARNLSRMSKLFPQEYNFHPKSWSLPADLGEFRRYARLRKHKDTYIVKPDAAAQGRGIHLINGLEDLKPGLDATVSKYIANPLTIDGFKFDLRLYVLVTSCDPWRIYLNDDGLARFATVKYEAPTADNLNNKMQHLTNYSINKFSSDFMDSKEADTGSKRKVSAVFEMLERKGVNIDRIWAEIEDLVIKLLLSADNVLKHHYRSYFSKHRQGSGAFEILGIDVLLDNSYKPWIIEVNHSCSFNCDGQVDREVKEDVILDALKILNFKSDDFRISVMEEKRRMRERSFQGLKSVPSPTAKEHNVNIEKKLKELDEHDRKCKTSYRRIYPNNNVQYYEKFTKSIPALFSTTASSRARQKEARLMRSRIEHRQRQRQQSSPREEKVKADTIKSRSTKDGSQICDHDTFINQLEKDRGKYRISKKREPKMLVERDCGETHTNDKKTITEAILSCAHKDIDLEIDTRNPSNPTPEVNNGTGCVTNNLDSVDDFMESIENIDRPPQSRKISSTFNFDSIRDPLLDISLEIEKNESLVHVEGSLVDYDSTDSDVDPPELCCGQTWARAQSKSQGGNLVGSILEDACSINKNFEKIHRETLLNIHQKKDMGKHNASACENFINLHKATLARVLRKHKDIGKWENGVEHQDKVSQDLARVIPSDTSEHLFAAAISSIKNMDNEVMNVLVKQQIRDKSRISPNSQTTVHTSSKDNDSSTPLPPLSSPPELDISDIWTRSKAQTTEL
eukprot:UC4_evm3s670